jgi:hypothetical protein
MLWEGDKSKGSRGATVVQTRHQIAPRGPTGNTNEEEGIEKLVGVLKLQYPKLNAETLTLDGTPFIHIGSPKGLDLYIEPEPDNRGWFVRAVDGVKLPMLRAASVGAVALLAAGMLTAQFVKMADAAVSIMGG